MGQQAPGTATAHNIKDAVQDLPLGVFLGLAPGLASGTKCLIKFHSLSLRSVGYGFRGFHAPDVTPSCPLVGNFLNTLSKAAEPDEASGVGGE
jgi:hypothetical protein